MCLKPTIIIIARRTGESHAAGAEHNGQKVLYTFIGMDEFAARLHAYFSDHNCLLFK
jgi:hypothetical protein